MEEKLPYLTEAEEMLKDIDYQAVLNSRQVTIYIEFAESGGKSTCLELIVAGVDKAAEVMDKIRNEVRGKVAN